MNDLSYGKHTHTHIYSYIHAYTHSRIYPYKHARTYILIQTQNTQEDIDNGMIQVCVCVCVCVCGGGGENVTRRTYTVTHIHTNTPTQPHTNTYNTRIRLPVHHIQMQIIRTRLHHTLSFLRETAHVAGKERRSYFAGARVTRGHCNKSKVVDIQEQDKTRCLMCSYLVLI